MGSCCILHVYMGWAPCAFNKLVFTDKKKKEKKKKWLMWYKCEIRCWLCKEKVKKVVLEIFYFLFCENKIGKWISLPCSTGFWPHSSKRLNRLIVESDYHATGECSFHYFDFCFLAVYSLSQLLPHEYSTTQGKLIRELKKDVIMRILSSFLCEWGALPERV